jgi:hypothetical protein
MTGLDAGIAFDQRITSVKKFVEIAANEQFTFADTHHD